MAVARSAETSPATMATRTRARYGSRRESARIMEGSITMRTWTLRAAWRPIGVITISAAVLIAPATAFAQFGPPQEHHQSAAIGEKYHVEASFNFWNPKLFGTISSEQFGLIGSDISLTADLGYLQTRFHEFRFVLRPAKKH